MKNKTSIAKSRPSQYSTQYSYFLNNEEILKNNHKSSLFSNQQNSNQQASFRHNAHSQDKLRTVEQSDTSPINNHDFTVNQGRPKTSFTNNRSALFAD